MEMREWIEALTAYFASHGVSDAALAKHTAIISIAARVRQHSYIMAFSDTLYLLGSFVGRCTRRFSLPETAEQHRRRRCPLECVRPRQSHLLAADAL